MGEERDLRDLPIENIDKHLAACNSFLEAEKGLT
jgi:hypothetical protein